MSAIAKLLKKSSPPMTEATFDIGRVPPEFQAAAALLLPLHGERNGFYAFASALHVYGMDTTDETDLLSWNSPTGWREEFGELANGYFAFAEDVFGGQFCVSTTGFHHFNIESAQVRSMGEDAEGWAANLIERYGYWTGFPLAWEWQENNGPLPRGQRLFPRRPFVLGGDFEVGNLWAGSTDDNVGFYGYVARHVHDVPDGTAVEIELPNGKTLAGTMSR